MTDRPCLRCQHPVLLEDGHLTYCSYCGAPQIFLSQELQAEIADQTREFHDRSAPVPLAESAPAHAASRRWPVSANAKAGQQPWSLAVRYALGAAGITLLAGLLTLVVPAASILLFFWVLSAPILTVAFLARAPLAIRPSAGFAARLGLLTGMLVAAACAATFTAGLVLTRFVFHTAGPFDAQLAASFEQQRVAALQRLGTAVQPTLDMFTIPEYRVGVLLFALGASAAMYLFVSTLAAGLAGSVLRRRRSL